MFCDKCGAEINNNAQFCTKCGAKINESTYILPDYNYYESGNVSGAAMPPEKPKGDAGKKGLIIGIVAASVVLLGLIAFLFVSIGSDGGFSNLFHGSSKTSSESHRKEKDDDEDYEDDDEDMNKKGTGKDDKEDIEDENDKTVAEKDKSSENGKTVIEKQQVDINVRQIDNTNFPEVKLYANVLDEAGNSIEDLKSTDLVIKEIGYNGAIINASIKDVYRLKNKDIININLVFDKSGSMDGSKMVQAKNAANSLIDQMTLEKGDRVEVIAFDDYVYLEQEFTSDRNLLHSAINNIEAWGSTALLDAIYSGVYQTYFEEGAKCVIAFTDGAENASSYSYDDVVEISRNTGIPVYIIGIGDGYDASMLQSLAMDCSGRYYSADTSDLESILEDIYLSIYHEQQDYYIISYTSSDTSNVNEFREVVVETSPDSEFNGTFTKSYVPQTDISGAFGDYANRDYMIDDSATRTLTESDLRGMSLAQLRIARNEIFARHGRQFKDPLLNQWFYSKSWYLNIGMKYSPSQFDALRPNPLSRTEIDNCDFIKAYEDNMIATQDIFPNAASVALSEYDLALTDEVLEKALAQLNSYPYTATLEENKRKIQAAIDAEDIIY